MLPSWSMFTASPTLGEDWVPGVAARPRPVTDTYLDHHRINDGDAEAMTDAAYAAWHRDRKAGLASVLIAETRENITALNVRARADLILDGTLKPRSEITLSDGSMAGVGDTIITRRKDWRLRNRHGWVRNGQTWTIAAEHDRWESITQLVAEYETIATAAQHDCWAALIKSSGLTSDQAQAVIDFDVFGALTAELRWAEANHHNIDSLLPRLIKARGFADADDIASVIHHRLAHASARPAGSGRTRYAPRFIAGLIPEATGALTPDLQRALNERRQLIETRSAAVLDTALQKQDPWTKLLGEIPAGGQERQQW